ncbi:hypothetical protein VTK73DRAFT_2884 [Phialemonium thermophilum]|uniref:Mitochondrial inner membrane protein 1 n=1 Tax=Phialemonium thermophilum TaxID=223376 RepID=A0ABR3VQ10_9PEZI
MLRGIRSAFHHAPARAAVPRPRVSPRQIPSLPSSGSLRFPQPLLLPSLPPLPWAQRTEFSSKPPVPPVGIDKAHEKKIAQQKLEPHPERVSSRSTVRPLIEPSGDAETTGNDEDVLRGVKTDLKTVVDTFSLKTVPREPLTLGLAGTLPYLATSIATVYLSWDLNKPLPTASAAVNSVTVGHDTAAAWVHLLEPIQLGYGAVLISFLGAIHWGLEFGEHAPNRQRTLFRYGTGVLAPALAWPTLLLPVEWALTSQFLAFVVMYFADARATVRGWAPAWYGTYRFVLTFIVGSALFISLVGRAKIGEGGQLSSQGLKTKLTQTTMGAEPYSKWAAREQKEKEEIRKQKEEEEKRRKEEEKKKEEEAEKKKSEEGQREKAEREKEAVKEGDKNAKEQSGDKDSKEQS